MPHQALLPAPLRSGARHVAFPHHHPARPGPDARAARPRLRPVSAAIRSRHPRRSRQIAHRPKLYRAGNGWLAADHGRGLSRPSACVSVRLTPSMSSLSAADVIRLLDLAPHPEGGHYRETFRDAGAKDGRALSTAIYFLLARGERSHWHRVDA